MTLFHYKSVCVAMASRRQGERTPLIGHANANGPRRRAQPQAQSQTRISQVFSPTLPEFEEDVDKEDRRTLCHRLTTACSARKAAHDARFQDERYYEDDFNDHSWKCSFGTSHEDGIWCNRSDKGGLLMAVTVWLLIVYSALTVTLLATNNHLPYITSALQTTICALALASHVKCMLSDPGAIPPSAVPPERVQKQTSVHAMCSHCQSYKPQGSHHCRICDRCIAHMDHHCPWMNNCIGAGNLKFFILFLVYVWIGAVFSLLIFGGNYFLCDSEECAFSPILIQLVRCMTLICIGAFLFTSNMLMTVVYTIMTGLTTIDRLKRKAKNTVEDCEEEPIDLEDVFGIEGYWTWFLPIDPIFQDWDKVMGYSTTERLLREDQTRGFVDV